MRPATPGTHAAASTWLADNQGKTLEDVTAATRVEGEDGTSIPLYKRIIYYRQRRDGREGSRPLTDEGASAWSSCPGGTGPDLASGPASQLAGPGPAACRILLSAVPSAAWVSSPLPWSGNDRVTPWPNGLRALTWCAINEPLVFRCDGAVWAWVHDYGAAGCW